MLDCESVSNARFCVARFSPQSVFSCQRPRALLKMCATSVPHQILPGPNSRLVRSGIFPERRRFHTIRFTNIIHAAITDGGYNARSAFLFHSNGAGRLSHHETTS